MPRHPQRERLAALAAAAGLPWALLGGMPVHAGNAGGTKSQMRLTVAAFPMVDAIVRAALPRWRDLQPGVEVEVVSRPYADHHTAMTTALSTSTHLPDVMALEASYLGRFALGTGLQDLSAPPFEAGALASRFVPYAFEQAADRQGRCVALPADIGPGTLLYRADLLDRAGLDPATLSLSWESYLEAGTRIRAATGAHLLASAQGLKDIVIRSGRGPGEGLYFHGDGRVLVTSPRFVRAFELARELRRRRLDARVQAWSNEWAEAFRRGQLATELSGAWMVGQLASWVAPDTRGKWRAVALPADTHVAYGGTFYAMPRRSDPTRKAMAWALMRMLTLEPALQLQAFRDQDAFPALVQTHDDPFFAEPLPFLGGQPARSLWRDSARRIAAMPLHRQNGFAEEVVATELDNVLERGKAIAQALADAQRLLERRARR